MRVGGRQSNATYQYTLRGQDLAVAAHLGRTAGGGAEGAVPSLTDVNTDQEDHGLESFVTID